MNAHGFEFYSHFIANTDPKEVPDIICIQETWYNDYNIINFPDYYTAIKNRDPGGRGGLAIYVHNSVTYQEMETNPQEEYQRIDIFSLKGVISVFNYYNPCKKIELVKLEEMTKTCKNEFILVGDFNAHSFLWGSNKEDANGKVINEFIEKQDLILLNEGTPTRLDPHTGLTSCLDLTIATKRLASDLFWNVSDKNFGSDHSVIQCWSRQEVSSHVTQNTNKEKVWSFKNVDWGVFKDKIKQKCIEMRVLEIIHNLNVQGKYNLIVSIINETAENTFKKVSQNGKGKNPVPWWSPEVKQAIAKRNNFKNRLARHYRIDDLENYRKAKAQAQRVKRNAKQEFWKKYCKSMNRMTDLGKVWKNIKQLESGNMSRNIIKNLLDEKKGAVTSPLDKANLIANAFKSIENQGNNNPEKNRYRTHFEKEVIDKLILQEENDHPLNDEFTMEELKDALKEMKNTAPGKDGIKSIMLQNLPQTMFTCLLLLFNEIWKHSIFPYQWYHCVQIPVLKPGKDPTNPGSYRPISLIVILCKLMERMVKNRLVWFLQRSNLLSPFQSGFRKYRSTLDQLLRLETDVQKGLMNKEYVAVVFLDLEKAYNTLWRKGIIYKCYKLGCKGNMLKWICTFLENRTCEVKINGQYSGKYVLEKGTPQGSVVSPILFNIMLHDLIIREPHVKLSIYADDIALWCSGTNLENVQQKMQRSLDEISVFCSKWNLKLSSQKSAVMVFTNKNQRDIILSLEGNLLQQHVEYKFLGMWFDHKMTWSKHISVVKEKCKKRLNLLRCISGTDWGSNQDILLMVYKGLILSIMDYGCELYDAACPTSKSHLDSIQYQALKIITGACHTTSLEALQVECGEIPLKFRRQAFVDKYNFYLLSWDIQDHSTVEIIIPSWYYDHFEWKPGQGPFFKRAITTDCEMEKMRLCTTIQPFWHYKCPNISYYVYNKINKMKDSEYKIRNCVLERIATKWNGYLKIYTDGSKQDDGEKSTGAAFYIADINIRKFYRLSTICIMRAELVAILLALEWIDDFPCTSAVIITDSLSALQALEDNHTRSNLVIEVRYMLNKLQSQDKEIHFEWVPSHRGICGNEIVDKLAKEGSLKESIDVRVPSTKEELTKHMKSHYKEIWQYEWEISEKGRDLFNIQENVGKHIKVQGYSRKEMILLHQIRLGKCRLNYYLYVIKQHENGMCDICNVPETIEHYLSNCTKYNRERTIMKNSLKIQNVNVGNVMNESSKDNFRSLMRYIKDTKRLY